MAVHGKFRQFRTRPKFLFGYQSTSGLDTWHGLNQRVNHKIMGMIAARKHKLLTFEAPHYEPMGKSATGEDMLTLRYQRQLWKFGHKGKFFRFSEVGLKLRYRNFPALWLFSQWRPPCKYIESYGKMLAYVMSYRILWICMTLRKSIYRAKICS